MPDISHRTTPSRDRPAAQGGSPDEEALLPVRMLNEYAYCPRLFHLMHVEGRWEDNHYTVEGKNVHRRVDRIDQVLPDAEGGGEADKDRKAEEGDGDEPPEISRSVPLSSERLGLSAKLDLVSTVSGVASAGHSEMARAASEAMTDPDEGSPVQSAATPATAEAVPVETKRGRVPNNEERSYEPERVQLMAQGLLLREHGYHCDHGVLYFAGSRTRVDVPFTDALEARTMALIEQARHAARSTALPPPLDDSPKCRGCSLNGICLPDETLALQQAPPDAAAPAVRRLYPARDEALPLYVQEPGARVGKSGRSLVVSLRKEELARARLKDTSQLVLCGNVSVTAQTIHLLCEAGIPIVHLSMGHWFHGITQGMGLRNAYDRAAQFAAAGQPQRCLAFARELVAAKGANQRTQLRRNGSPDDRTLRDMKSLAARTTTAGSLEELLGIEGNLAAHYFRNFAGMLRPRDFDAEWDFAHRNRRPPRDRVNALLSFGYALLTKECTVALLAEGLDPWWGLYHQPRHGRPSLALDLMEPLRPLIVDSAVLTAVNTGMVAARNFTLAKAGCMLTDTSRKAMIRAYEARLDQLVTHPVFDYRCSWRAAIRLQARLFSRWLRGDVPRYESIVTR